MSASRPIDWSPLGLSGDPTPGDPDAVADLAARFRRTAEAVKTATDGLNRIHSSYVGKGGEKLRERTRDLAKKVDEVHERYAGAADALDSYHPEQYAAQRLADDALRRAVDAKHQSSSTSWTLSQIPDPPTDGTTEDFTVTNARNRAEQDHKESAVLLAKAQDDAKKAHHAQQDAGARAAAKLKGIIARDGLNDSWKDNVKGDIKTMASHLKGLAKLMDKIAAWTGVLALALSWVPFVGEALALVALVATAIGFLANLTLLVTGQGSLSDTLWDLVGLLSFGVGRVVEKAGGIAVKGARARAWHAGTKVFGKGRTATLIGGKLSKAERGMGAPAEKAMDEAARRALSPKEIAGDYWKAIRGGQRTAPGDWFNANFRSWKGTFTPFSGIDDKLLKLEFARDSASVQAAGRYRTAGQVNAVSEDILHAHDASEVGADVKEMVDPEPEPLEMAELPKSEIKAARMPDDELAAQRAQALARIRLTRQVITSVRTRTHIPADTSSYDQLVRS